METRKFCLLGYSLKHTMSPPIHSKLFELDKKTFEYFIMDIAPNDLKKNVPLLKSLGGYNVTIPHKIPIIPFLNKLDISAERYGAVNCVSNSNGISTGYNTDYYGFLRALESGNLSLKGNVLLLGCGGAGRMMAIETIRNGGNLTIAVRPDDIQRIKQMDFTKNAHITSIDSIESYTNENFDLLINATPVGMFPNINSCPTKDLIIQKCSGVFDAVYNPTDTILLKKAKEFGCKYVGGMAMLVWQAVVAHEIWDNSQYNNADIVNIINDMATLI